ncbi:hypothetical protein AY600_02050 [Phormidium willei BDU 130791]|nr:hypothetical protein AY600_02050 [Phormidium willei BDU 130791]
MTSPLNIRSHFSLGESTLTPDCIKEEVEARGYKSAALVDTMSISGMPDFTRAMQKISVKPVIGVRLRVVETLDKDKSAKNQPVWMPKLYIRTQDGLARMMRLLSLANDDEHFYYKPRLLWNDVVNELERDAFVFTTGDFNSLLTHPLAGNMIEMASVRLGGKAFVELIPVDSPLWDRVAHLGVQIADERELNTLVTCPALYRTGRDRSLDLLATILGGAKLGDRWALEQYVREFTFKSGKELAEASIEQVKRMRERYGPHISGSFWQAGLREATGFAENYIGYEWEKMPVSLPTMAPDEDAALVEACKTGWMERFTKPVFGHKPTDLTPYKERLRYELDVLKGMGFSGYFLLVQEIVKWAKDNDILVGPGRGSVGGSLVAYLMGITDVDPLRFNLLFERFINPERIDLPDADLDFMSTRRHEVIEHISHKYGWEKVAGISNYTALGSGSALRDVGRIHGLDFKELSISKLIPKPQGQPMALKDAREEVSALDTFANVNKQVWDDAVSLEGVMRGLGRHAAGVVVAGCDLIDRSVVETRNGERTVNWDKRVVEEMGLVKMDILGLSTLDMIREAMTHIWERHMVRFDPLALPLDDEKTLAGFSRGDTIGVFQFESGGMRKLLKDLAVGGTLTFEDIAAATALYRPGPMDSGLLEDFVAIRQGFQSPSYDHPNMQNALEPTYSVIVYQEQVMQLARDLAGFTFAEADHLRKAMGKKDKAKMASLKEKWVEGCHNHSSMNETRATLLWDKIEKFAGYGFNKSHAVEYSLISYISMYIKAHYPVEFYAAAMTILDDDKLPGLLTDAKARHIAVTPPDINVSTGRFEILTDTQLCAPFSRVKGVSLKGSAAILEAREAGPFKSQANFLKRVEKRRCNKRVVEALEKVGAFVRIEPSHLPVDHPDRQRDLAELMPSLVLKGVNVTRSIDIKDTKTRARLNKLIKEYMDSTDPIFSEAVPVKPGLGKTPRFMVITDGPTWSEEQGEKFTAGATFAPYLEALSEAGLSKEDAYWTGLHKVAKLEGEKFYTKAQTKANAPYIEAEIDILRPPVIMLMGTGVARHFLKDMKGPVLDHAGKVVFNKELDCNIVVGFNANMIHHDGSKQAILNDLFRQVADMIVPL